MAAPGIPGIPAIPPVQGKAEMALDAARVYAEEEAKRKRLECRFYEAQYPEIEEVVMVNVRNIAEMGAYVVLLEYNDIEGMILLSELSRRRIRSISKLIRVNRNEVAMVLRVDKEKVCGAISSRIVKTTRSILRAIVMEFSAPSRRRHRCSLTIVASSRKQRMIHCWAIPALVRCTYGRRRWSLSVMEYRVPTIREISYFLRVSARSCGRSP